jgi:hypothetical protein
MPATYEPIATNTLSSAASSITFSSISSAYTDLRLIVVPTAASAGPNTYLRFNSDTGSNYSSTYLLCNGTDVTAYRETSVTEMLMDVRGLSATNPSLLTVDIYSYANATFKTVIGVFSEVNGGSAGQVGRYCGLWRSTSAITSLSFRPVTGNFSIGTTATLYGIKAA